MGFSWSTSTAGGWPPICWSCGAYITHAKPQWCRNTSHWGTMQTYTYGYPTTTTDTTFTFKVYEPEEEVNEARPEWDEIWMGLADLMAKRSKCCRAQVGAVVVDSEQNVVSVSYNGPPRGFEAEGDCSNWCPRAQKVDNQDLSPTYDDCVTAHAESNAIARADYSRMAGGTIYISTSPCKSCAKIFANSGIVRVVYRDEADREYRNADATRTFIEECGLEVTIYE